MSCIFCFWPKVRGKIDMFSFSWSTFSISMETHELIHAFLDIGLNIRYNGSVSADNG